MPAQRARERSARPTVPVPTTRPRGRRSRYDVIVVGSGIGGAVAAALLARRGERVLVVEKNHHLGGILATSSRGGFKIDRGSHLIARGDRGPIGDVLRALGLSHPRLLTHGIPVRSRGMLDVTAPAHRRDLPARALDTARALGLPLRDEVRLARLLLRILTMSEAELCRWDLRTLDELIRRYSEHPGAYFLFSFLASIFFVLPPWEVAAGEAIRALRAIFRDYRLSYVEGGMDALPHALLAAVEPAGGDLVVGQRVVAIRPAPAGLAVCCGDGASYEAPVVVANVAPSDGLRLLDGIDVPAVYRARVAAIRGSGNAHQIKLGLRRKLVDEGCLIAGVSLMGKTLDDLSYEMMRQTVAAIDAGRVSDPLAIYAPVPTNYDPTLAPPGHQLIVASVYGPVRPDPADRPAIWEGRILEAFAQIVPGLLDELVFVDFTPIPAVAAWMGRSNAGAVSNGQRPGQVGRDRLPVVTPVPGLYWCGDGAGGRGIGMELAAASALEVLAARRAVADRRARRPAEVAALWSPP